MWKQIWGGGLLSHVVIFYFLHSYLRFTPLIESPLYDNIGRFTNMEDIIPLGDFNAHTKDDQMTLFDTRDIKYGEVVAK